MSREIIFTALPGTVAMHLEENQRTLQSLALGDIFAQMYPAWFSHLMLVTGPVQYISSEEAIAKVLDCLP